MWVFALCHKSVLKSKSSTNFPPEMESSVNKADFQLELPVWNACQQTSHPESVKMLIGECDSVKKGILPLLFSWKVIRWILPNECLTTLSSAFTSLVYTEFCFKVFQFHQLKIMQLWFCFSLKIKVLYFKARICVCLSAQNGDSAEEGVWFWSISKFLETEMTVRVDSQKWQSDVTVRNDSQMCSKC